MTGHEIEYCGFGQMNASTSSVIGEAYWAGIPEGTQVNIAKAQRAIQKRFRDAHIAVVPWSVPGIDEMTKAFIMDNETQYLEGREFGDYKKGFNDKLNEMTTDYLEQVMQKADSTSTLASSLMHVIADEQVTYLYKRPYPFQALIPVEANKGKTASWDSVGPYEITQAAFGKEDPDLQETDMTAHNRTDTIKYMYTVGRLTKAVKYAGLSQVPVRDIKAIRIDLAQDAMRALRERAMLGITRNLQSTTNEYEAKGQLEYAGVYELMTNASSYANKCYFTSSGTLYADIMFDLDKSYNQMVLMGMQPNVAICDYKTFGIIRRGVVQFLRYIGEPVKTIVPGVSKIDLVFPGQSGLSLVPHAFMPQTTGANGSIMLLDTRLLARRVLWQDTYEELANINTSEKFVISASETLIDKSDIDGSSSLQGGVFGITI
jgi:hypothetical protein